MSRRWFVTGLAALAACTGGDPEARYAELKRAFSDAYREGRVAQALQAATEAVRLVPEREEPYRLASQAFADLGRDEEAVEFYAAVARRHGGVAWPWFFRGFHNFLLNRYDAALEDFTRAAALDPQNAECDYRRGLVLERLGRFEEAIEAFRRSWQHDPEKDSAVAHLVDALRKVGDYEGMERAVRDGLLRFPDHAQLLQAAGQLALRRQDYTEAERDLRRAIERDPRLAAAHHDLAKLLARTGREDEARDALLVAKRLDDYEFLKKYLLDHRTSLNAPLLLGELELTENRLDEALRYFHRAERALGPSARLAAGRAETLFRQGRLEEAQAALAPYAGATDARLLLAHATGALARGQHAEAARQLEVALQDAPEERQFFRRAADLARALGDPARARALLQRAQQAKPVVVEGEVIAPPPQP